jgi:hypothetical protein
MNVRPTDSVSLYGIRSNRDKTLRDCKKVIKDIIPVGDKQLSIYTGIDFNDNKIYKLYYLTDSFGKWIKSKLVYFDNNKNKTRVLRSERKEWVG